MFLMWLKLSEFVARFGRKKLEKKKETTTKIRNSCERLKMETNETKTRPHLPNWPLGLQSWSLSSFRT